MQQKIFCLMASGIRLSEEACDSLFFIALTMFNEKTRRRTFKAVDCEGEIKTDFRHAAMGDISGMVFEAKVEVGIGPKKTVRYIVRTNDLEHVEKGVWSEWEQSSRQQGPARSVGAMAN